MSFFAALAVNTLVRTTSSHPILTVTVQDYLWGYHDPLIALASAVVPTVIPFKKFGLLDRMFDDGVNVVTMNLPKAVKDLNEAKKAKEAASVGKVQEYEPLVRDYSIDVWNGSPGLHHWGYTNDKGDAAEKYDLILNTFFYQQINLKLFFQ